MRYFVLLITAIFLLAGCQPSGHTNPTASAEAKRYDMKGTVVSVDKAKKRAKIDHQDIPGFMDAMTMDFPIHDDSVLAVLTPGSEVRAQLVVDSAAKDPYWLENISVIAAADPNIPAPPVNENSAQVGKEIPDFELTDQDGKRFSLTDYRGKALAITFIYSECPLPDYCIKMSANFSDLANRLKDDKELRDKIRLLSISFDPARDTPDKLKSYGMGYLGKDAKPDFAIWQLAVGSDKEVRSVADFFGLHYEVDPNDKTQFTHSLRTIVVSPEGKITKIFSGNEWTTDELLAELQRSMGQ
jgi:protein SCO1/2